MGRQREEEPETFAQVQALELSAIHAARQRDGMAASASPDRLVGLALSGGGIRSATFCLGVLQALAKRSKLTCFDYLSTVSGGGYIGAWLSAWVNRDGLLEVEKALKPRVGIDAPPEPAAVNWLRQYSNYLAPRLGLLSADSLTLIATWARNVFLNLVIFVSLLVVVFLIPRVLVAPALVVMTHHAVGAGYAAAWFGFFVFPTLIAVNLSSVVDKDSQGGVNWLTTTPGVFCTVIASGVLATVLASLSLFSRESHASEHLTGLAWGSPRFWRWPH